MCNLTIQTYNMSDYLICMLIQTIPYNLIHSLTGKQNNFALFCNDNRLCSCV